jgi:hypothetical protein
MGKLRREKPLQRTNLELSFKVISELNGGLIWLIGIAEIYDSSTTSCASIDLLDTQGKCNLFAPDFQLVHEIRIHNAKFKTIVKEGRAKSWKAFGEIDGKIRPINRPELLKLSVIWLRNKVRNAMQHKGASGDYNARYVVFYEVEASTRSARPQIQSEGRGRS